MTTRTDLVCGLCREAGRKPFRTPHTVDGAGMRAMDEHLEQAHPERKNR